MNKFLITAVLCVAPIVVHAQADFSVGGRTVQVHSFLSQGFAYSNDNNFLTMNTSQGSAAMTDFGVNVTTQLTDKFRVGMQLYDRNIGQLGGWHPLLDYAYGDYRLKDWFGIRAGRVKTQLGLYTSTQDADFLRTFALLPQSIYPTDLRSQTIAHDGVDVYGAIPLSRAGSLNYTMYAGVRPTDRLSGQYFQLQDSGFGPSINASMAGADLRWNTPVSGLLIGTSVNFQKEHGTNSMPVDFWRRLHESTSYNPPFFTQAAGPDRKTAAYVDYNRGKLHLAGEYRRNIVNVDLRGLAPFPLARNLNETAWFASAAYRVNKWLELGAYHSHYTVDAPFSAPFSPPPPSSANHIFDEVASLRFDLTRFWNVKLEGHFMDGTGDPYSPHGYYQRDNPTGLKPTMNMVVIRTGWNF
jgi:hypothetical protein